ncbi:hypothetical protein [Maribellus mangrovi]|uniref:hypothetical protein n=1 Tax=Maribellus mangrovi TaxID=3133146 RepID=UPI0030EBA7DF
MKKYDIIIIKAGPAGNITVVTAKKVNPKKSMLMFKEEEKGLHAFSHKKRNFQVENNAI